MGTNLPPVDVLFAAGPRASMAALLGWLRDHRLSLTALQSGEQRPIRVLVPNAVLRTHTSARIAEELGGVVAGVRVQTLYGYARESLEAAGVESRPAGALEQLFVRRATAASTHLGPLLSGLEEGLDTPLRSVRDLLGAGFGVGQDLPTGLRDALHPRSQAVLDLAVDVQTLASEAGLDLVSDVITRAAVAVQSGAQQPEARALAVFGFSDATEVGARLLRAALARVGGVYILDCPPSRLPGREGQLERGRAQALCESVTGRRPLESGRTSGSPSFDFFGASGLRGEVVELARRIRTRLDAGARPEGIAVVGVDIGPYEPAVRVEFEKLGIPFSGSSCRLVPGEVARWLGLPRLLSNPDDFAIDRLLDLVPSIAGVPLSPDNRVSLRAGYRRLGLSTLSDLPSARLPKRTDFVTQLDAPNSKGGQSTLRLSVPPKLHAGCTALAQDLLDVLRDWPEQASLNAHALALERVLDLLGFGSDKPCPPWLRSGWSSPEHSVSSSEFVALLEWRLDAHIQSPLGGRGGGVSVLSLRDSRGLTFDTLFVLGAKRGEFPASRADDPILPESERKILRKALVGLPQVGEDLDSSRHGLSQLLDCAESVILSWSSRDSSGRELGPAPLVRHLHGAKPDERLPEAPPRRGARLPAPSPTEDHLMAAAIHGDRSDFHRLRAALMSSSLGPVREAILEEFDPDRGNRESASRLGRLGPSLGQVGPDPGRSAVVLSATALERIAACPWQGFLKGSLKLSSTHDPRDGIPVVTSALLGTLVHSVLEEIAVEAGAPRGGHLEEPLGGGAGVSFLHPGRAAIERLALECAGEVLAAAGLHLPGLAEMLQRRALPLIEAAFEDVVGAAPAPKVLCVEAAGYADVLGRRLSFRADRVDREGDALRIVDYKSGAPPSVAARESTRRASYLKTVRSGKRLQGGIYAASIHAKQTAGTYVFLKPGLEPEHRTVHHPPDDPEFSEAFEQAAQTIFTALDQGNFFPRLTDPSGDKEGSACEYCEFTNVCLRGDSAQRGRLVRYARSPESSEQEGFAAMWKMPLGESEAGE